MIDPSVPLHIQIYCPRCRKQQFHIHQPEKATDSHLCYQCQICHREVTVNRSTPKTKPQGPPDPAGGKQPCAHERLNEDGICRMCGEDRRRG